MGCAIQYCNLMNRLYDSIDLVIMVVVGGCDFQDSSSNRKCICFTHFLSKHRKHCAGVGFSNDTESLMQDAMKELMRLQGAGDDTKEEPEESEPADDPEEESEEEDDEE